MHRLALWHYNRGRSWGSEEHKHFGLYLERCGTMSYDEYRELADSYGIIRKADFDEFRSLTRN